MSDFTVYTKQNCPFCDRAKNLIKLHGYDIQEIEVPTQASRDDVQAAVTESGSSHVVRTVPQIFFNGEYIGGYEQLVKYFAS